MSLSLMRRQIDELGERLAPASAAARLEDMAETPNGRDCLRTHEAMARHGLLRPLSTHLTDALDRTFESDNEADRAEFDALHSEGYYRLTERVIEEERDETLLLLAFVSFWEYAELTDLMDVYGLPGWENKLIEMTAGLLNLSGLTRKSSLARLHEEADKLHDVLDHRVAEMARGN